MSSRLSNSSDEHDYRSNPLSVIKGEYNDDWESLC